MSGDKNHIPHPQNSVLNHHHHTSIITIIQPYNSFRTRLKTPVANSMANVVELKVGLHCEECIKKILKAIKKIEDIETYDIDTELSKVTVTGNVTSEEVIRVLHKIGKQSHIWGQQPPVNDACY